MPILIDDLPSEALVADGLDPRLLGLFQGTPMPEDDALAPTVTNILLFRGNLQRACVDAEHLADEIRITVLHETRDGALLRPQRGGPRGARPGLTPR